jgi:hypothetical protein
MRIIQGILAMALLAACNSSDDTTFVNTSVAGTYNLVSVSGATLPIVVQAANPKIELISEQVVLNADGTLSMTTTKRTTSATGTTSDSSISATGTYTVTGSALQLLFSNGGIINGTVLDNSITLIGATSSSLYVK